MADTRVTMPQLGESVHEGTISRWLVKPGDRVVEFEPMLEVDTDKVSAEVPSPVTGILKEIIATEGQTVQAGAEIAVVEVAGGAGGEQASAPAVMPDRTGTGAGDAMPSAGQAEAADAEERPRPPAASSEAAVAAEPPRAPAPAGPAPAAASGAGHRYSPGVLMLAEEQGVDLARVTGTGLGGRVTKKDVRLFAEAQATPPPPPAPTAAASGPAEPASAREGDQAVPLTRVRRLIAENMSRSKATIPHAWQTQEVDMAGVVASRAAHKARFQQDEGFSLTYLPYVIKAAAVALREHPEVNATFNDTEILVHRDVNVGVSIGLEDTLMVPVIRSADGLSVAGIARAVSGFAERARSKQVRPDDLTGGTFTVNNSGTFGTLFSYSVINPGQAGILTMEAIVQRPVAVQGMIAIKPMMYLCFSFDHRALDGLQAARFLTSARKWLEAVNAESPIY